jgi:hypothetical protein
MKRENSPSTNSASISKKILTMLPLALLQFLPSGCGKGITTVPASSTSLAIRGTVLGSGSAVRNASVQLFAIDVDGNNLASDPSLSDPVTTDSSGNFNISKYSSCPSSDSVLYVTARGGMTPSYTAQNSASALMAVLGPCNSLSAVTPITVNEVTTVGSIWPIAAAGSSAKRFTPSSSQSSFYIKSQAQINKLINLSSGSAPGPAAVSSDVVPVTKLNALADLLAFCVDSQGGTAGDGSPCGQLFQYAARPDTVVPQDTIAASFLIARNPDSNVAQLYNLIPSEGTYEPQLTKVPDNLSLAVTSATAAPVISAATGTYYQAQTVSIAAASGETIHYTLNGSTPTASSATYSGPFQVSANTTVQAMAVSGSTASAVSTSTLTFETPKLVFTTQPASFIAGQLMPSVKVSVESPSGALVALTNSTVTLALGGTTTGSILQGTVTEPVVSGVATFSNLTTATPGGYTLTASSSGCTSAVSSSFNAVPSIFLSSSATTVSGGSTGTINVTLNKAAQSGALTIALSTSNSQVLSLASTSIVIPAGATTGTVGYTALAAGPATVTGKNASYVAGSLAMAVTSQAISLSSAASTTAAGATGTILVTLNNAAQSGGVSVSLATSNSQVLSLASSSVVVPAGGTTASVGYTALAAGTAVVAGTSSSYVRGSLAMTITSETIPATFFGMSVNKASMETLNMPYTYGTTRTWDVYPGLGWNTLNPSSGVYNWTNLDNYIAANAATNKADIIYTLGLTPQWASSSPNTEGDDAVGACAPPVSMTVWNQWLTAVATHTLGKIHIWELWNEPQDVGYYCGTTAQMLQMAQQAYTTIKGIDPTAIILTPAPTGGNGPSWMATYLAAGGGNYADVVAFHGYGNAVGEDIISVVNSYASVTSSYGVSGKPLWDTEASWNNGGATILTAAQQAAFLPKYYLLQWSMGVSRFVWYEYDGGGWGGLWTASGGINPAGIAWGQVQNWMLGATISTPCAAASNSTYTCGLTRSAGYQALAVWNDSGVSYTPSSIYTQYRDVAGNVTPLTGQVLTLTSSPILLETGTSPYPN